MLIACQDCHRQYDVDSLEPGRKVRCFCGTLTEVPVPRSAPTRMSHCFSCGGPLRDGGNDCRYCGGTVSLPMRGAGDACPECFARLARGARFCACCGVEIKPTSVVKALTATSCPRCKGELALCEGEGHHFTECLSCGGLWLDERRFETLLESKRDEAVERAPVFARSARGPAASPDEPIRYLPCPSCAGLMQRRNFGQGSGIILDWCRGHGIWFDGCELEQVLAWAAQQPDRARWSRAPQPARSAPRSGSLPLEPPRRTSGFPVLDILLNLFTIF